MSGPEDGRSDGRARRGGRVRCLLIAEAANPEWSSVPLEGWSHSRAIAGITDAHVVTQIRNKGAFERAGLVEGREFTAIDSELVARAAWRASNLLRGGSGKGWTTVTAVGALTYPYFERLVWKRFGARIRAGEFDVVHRLTPLSPTTPSLLARKCGRAGVPFVLGPLNGGVPWPKEFDAARRKEREWLSYVRGAYKMLPGFRETRRNAAAIIVGSRDTWAQMPERYRHKCVYIPENAIDPSRFTAPRERRAGEGGTLRAVFVGRLVPYKGPDMLLEAAAPLVREGALTVDVVGDGPMMPELRAMVEREGLGGGVTLHGNVPHGDVQRHLASADVLAFPSIREFGGAVVLEAMAVGVAPLVVGYGGPAELVTEGTGWAVPIGGREEIVAAFRDRLSALAANPGEVERIGEAAARRARGLFTWEAKARQVLEVYRWVLGERDEKPDFGMPLPDAESAWAARASIAVGNGVVG